MASPSLDIQKVVDAFLAREKTLAGAGSWVRDSHERSYRCIRPVEVDGELPGLDLIVKAYPRSHKLQFRIILAYGKAIWRLCYAEDNPHINSLDRPIDLDLGPITGPHYHSWKDNRHFATLNALPSSLHNARVLPENLRTFESAFRWFCGETRIIVGNHQMLTLPRSDTLL
jgi:hypothetical protein